MSSDSETAEGDEEFEWQESDEEEAADGEAAAETETEAAAEADDGAEAEAETPAVSEATSGDDRELVSDHPIKGEILREVLEYFKKTDIDESFAEPPDTEFIQGQFFDF